MKEIDLWPLFWIALIICMTFEDEIKERLVGHPIKVEQVKK